MCKIILTYVVIYSYLYHEYLFYCLCSSSILFVVVPWRQWLDPHHVSVTVVSYVIHRKIRTMVSSCAARSFLKIQRISLRASIPVLTSRAAVQKRNSSEKDLGSLNDREIADLAAVDSTLLVRMAIAEIDRCDEESS